MGIKGINGLPWVAFCLFRPCGFPAKPAGVERLRCSMLSWQSFRSVSLYDCLFPSFGTPSPDHSVSEEGGLGRRLPFWPLQPSRHVKIPGSMARRPSRWMRQPLLIQRTEWHHRRLPQGDDAHPAPRLWFQELRELSAADHRAMRLNRPSKLNLPPTQNH